MGLTTHAKTALEVSDEISLLTPLITQLEAHVVAFTDQVQQNARSSAGQAVSVPSNASQQNQQEQSQASGQRRSMLNQQNQTAELTAANAQLEKVTAEKDQLQKLMENVQMETKKKIQKLEGEVSEGKETLTQTGEWLRNAEQEIAYLQRDAN